MLNLHLNLIQDNQCLAQLEIWFALPTYEHTECHFQCLAVFLPFSVCVQVHLLLFLLLFSIQPVCYFLLADNVHKEQSLVIKEDQAANQPHRREALPSLCCSCTRTSLSTIICTKAWCNEDKMLALTIVLLCVGKLLKLLQFSLSYVCETRTRGM